MLAAQTALSMLGIPEDLNVARPSYPQSQVNDSAGAVLYAAAALVSGSYQSPSSLPLPTSLPGWIPTDEQKAAGVTAAQAIKELVGNPLNPWNVLITNAVGVAWANYVALCTSGNLPAIHQAVDAINAWNPLTGYRPFAPMPDFQLLTITAGVIGQFAQQCGPGQQYFPYGIDPATAAVIAMIRNGSGPASMQPTLFFQTP